MTGTKLTGTKEKYVLGQEIGKGGEGQVFDVQNSLFLVVKIYNERLSANKIEKLVAMVEMASPQLEAYAAWPIDIVENQQGEVIGFVMKKLSSYVPLHSLFSPMDRKQLFPDKGYNFLVHVARNLCTAFYTIHSLGLIVGDVNEGNILVNNQGMVAFIDCDSFQIKSNEQYYYCEVGVPRYTPPELLELGSFDKVIRTTNTDLFSMAILVFQLLFLGRHPFAGKNTTDQDIDEETAIKYEWFAYSSHNNHGKLLPPNDSLPLKTTNEALQVLFHQSFENRIHRPLASEWITALDGYLKMMVYCLVSPIHIYPSSFKECPWCAFKNQRNILYFIDNTPFQNAEALDNLEDFINGFKVEKITFPKLKSANNALEKLQASPIPAEYYRYKQFHLAAIIVPILVGIGVSFVNIGGGILFAVISFATPFIFPWKGHLKKELKKRSITLKLLKDKLDDALNDYTHPKELALYKQLSEKINTAIDQFKKLPQELLATQKAMEEMAYNHQLQYYLSLYSLKNNRIAALGETRLIALESAGIKTVADIGLLKRTKVVGVGPKLIQALFSWQRQIASGFVYYPDNAFLQRESASIAEDIARLKKLLEADIKNTYQSITVTKTNIYNQQKQLQTYISILQKQHKQAELDYEAFKKIA